MTIFDRLRKRHQAWRNRLATHVHNEQRDRQQLAKLFHRRDAKRRRASEALLTGQYGRSSKLTREAQTIERKIGLIERNRRVRRGRVMVYVEQTFRV